MNSIIKIYQILYRNYGPQGWWPLIGLKGVNPTKTGSINGYHPGDYSYPKNKDQILEICLGAILTQNTSWPSVEKALINLKKNNALTIDGLRNLSEEKLKSLIKVAGYYNQKSRYIREFIKFFENLNGIPSRCDLLALKGIGPETADSILLYAFKVPTFVVDAYTRRIFSYLGFFDKKVSYDGIKFLFESNLKPDFAIFQEYHALIVEHAKRYYSKKPYGVNCPLRKFRI